MTRFAGGREYELTFNTTAFNSEQSPAQVVSAIFARVLDNAKIANPISRFEIIPAPIVRPPPSVAPSPQQLRRERGSSSAPTWNPRSPRSNCKSSKRLWPMTPISCSNGA